MAPGNQDPLPVPASLTGADRRLLIVDDDQDVLDMLRHQLRDQPYTVYTATNGPEALVVLDRRPVQVVVSDLLMPGMSGMDLLRRVQEGWPGVVRLVLSSATCFADILEAVNAGHIYSYLCKPWKREELLVALMKAFESHRLSRERDELLLRAHRLNRQLIRLNESLERRFQSRKDDLHHINDLVECAMQLHDQERVLAQLSRVLEQVVEDRRFVLYRHEGDCFRAVCMSEPLLTGQREVGFARVKYMFENGVRDLVVWREAFRQCEPLSGEVFSLRRETEPSAFLMVASGRRGRLAAPVMERVQDIMPLIGLVLLIAVGDEVVTGRRG